MAFKLNELNTDEFGRKSGIVAINKPTDMTSHDVVNIARRELNMRKIGHAGALDPFATGVLVLLIGKATKLSDKFINSDKEYIATILFGVKTDSADIEGNVLEVNEATEIDETELTTTLTKFSPEYEQYVPVYSSVKIDGQKLRVLARQADSHEVVTKEDGKYVIFHKGETQTEIKLPTHACKLPEIELLEIINDYDISGCQFYQESKDKISKTNWKVARVRVACSKGTYIRTLAEDIGAALPKSTPAMLVELERTRVDRINIQNSLQLEQLSEL